MENLKKEIEKIHKETCRENLKKASILTGKETQDELEKILERCQCILISNLRNDIACK